MLLRKSLQLLLYFFIFFLLMIINSFNIFTNYLYSPGPLRGDIKLLVSYGLSIKQISVLLTKSKVIKDPKLFFIISKFYSFFRPLKSGEYYFPDKVSLIQVIKELSNGKSVIHRLTLQEGLTVSEIVKKVKSQKILKGIISQEIQEGYLMPSTYFYSYGDKRENIINRMRLEMLAALDKVIEKLSPSSPIKSREDILILASIIEKEAANDNEKAKIAAVFINRLKKNMKLQACPTVLYALTKGKYKLTRALTKNDLKINSPYNTYHRKGLPVGAISCPGKKSLEAVVNPAKIDSLYFVINGNGGHYFSSTLNEHNQHIANLKRRLK